MSALSDSREGRGTFRPPDTLPPLLIPTQVKAGAKARVAEFILRECGVRLPPGALFDVHIKRIHEYKRQLLNLLYVVHR